MTLSEEEAIKEAAYELRFEIGNRPHLSDPTYDAETGQYVFTIRYTPVDLPDLDAGEEEVTYYEHRPIGEMRVDEDTGEIERTSNDELEEKIQDVKNSAERGEIEKL